MKKVSWLIAVAVITVLFFQCQKELHFIGGPDNGAPVTPDPIKASLQGNITDENDQPAAGVIITAGASTTLTDANGYFRFTDASLDKNTTLVTASKDGYFKGYRVFAATSGCNQVNMKLLKRNLAGTVAAAAGGEVALPDGSKVKLPANGVVTASTSSAYTGDVKVYAFYIDPRRPDISKTIPGSLVGNDKNGKRVALASYGMLAVELSSASGEKLQIKSGSAATLTIPIPSAGDVSAPATIPLWYVDETTGIWQEEGTATKQGNSYVGDVKHFSFWNCDYPYDAVNLSLTLQTPSGAPLIYSEVRITAVSTSDTGSSYLSTRYGYTDSLGQVSGLVPASKELTVEVLGNCGSVVYSQTVQSLTQDKDLGTIKITDNTSSLVTITGLLTSCNSTPVSNGYCIFHLANVGDRYVSVDSATGQFTTTYIFCSGTSVSGTVIGIDANAQQQSDVVNITNTSSVTNVGTITACGTSSSQYINYNIDGTAYNVTDASSDSSMNGYNNDSSGTVIYGGRISSGNNIRFSSGGGTTGTFSMLSLYLNGSYYTPESSSKVTFTGYPASVGSFYEGSLNGSYITNPSTDSAVTHIITGTFRVRRGN